MASEAEEFVMRLNSNIAAEAKVAEGALAQLEARLASTKAATTALGTVSTKAAAPKAPAAAGGAAAMKATASASKEASVEVDKLGKNLGKLGGPLGQAARGGGELSEAFTKLAAMGPAGIVAAIVVAVIALTAAAVAGAVAIARWGVGLADAARNQKLVVEGAENSSAALAGLSAIIPAVQASTGLAAADIQAMAVSMSEAGVKAGNLQAAVTALATAKAGGATEKFLSNLKAQLIATGKVPAELAAQMAKFQVIASAKMLSLDSQGAKLKANIGALFAGLKIEPLLKGLSTLVALFDVNTASGQALKFLFEALFQPLIDGATGAIPSIERAFLTLELWALRGYIAIVKFSRTDAGGMVLTGLKAIGIAIGVVVGAVAFGIAQMVAGFLLLQSTIGIVVVAVTAVWRWFTKSGGALEALIDIGKGIGAGLAAPFLLVYDAIKLAIGALERMNVLTGKPTVLKDPFAGKKFEIPTPIAAKAAAAGQAGANAAGQATSKGLAVGITAAAPQVVAALTGAVSTAIGAAKAMLGIASPSKVFAAIGSQTGAGMAQGVDASAPAVTSSIEDMAGGPTIPALPAAGAIAKGKERPAIAFNNCTFGGDLTPERLESWIVDIFHRNALDAEPAG